MRIFDIRRMDATTIQALAVTSLSIVNVWLVVQNARWFMYSPLVRNSLPHVDRYTRFDISLELPGILLGIIVSYLLILRLVLNVWGIRHSIFRDAIFVRVLSINSILLAILTVMAVVQWKIVVDMVPLDVFAVAIFGAAAAFVSYFMERRLMKTGQFTLTMFSPSQPLRSLASMWRKSKIS